MDSGLINKIINMNKQMKMSVNVRTTVSKYFTYESSHNLSED